MLSKLKVAIVGFGKIGRIREVCIRNHPDLELIAICDPKPPSEGDLGCRWLRDWRSLFDLPLDLVFICTPNEYIPEIAEAALEKGVHAFCEKPPGRTVEDIQRIQRAERRALNIKLKFGFNHRYHASVILAKETIESGELGRILWMRGVYGKSGGPDFDKNWRNNFELSGGGILIDQGIHMVDLFLCFAGPFDEVKSFIGQSYWNIPVEDNAFAIMRNKGGQTAMLHSSATQWRHKFQLEISLQRGLLTLSGILSASGSYGTECLKVSSCLYNAEGYPLPNPEESNHYFEEDNSWDLEINDFINCIKEDQPIKQGGSQEALEAMSLVHKIYSQDAQWASFSTTN